MMLMAMVMETEAGVRAVGGCSSCCRRVDTGVKGGDEVQMSKVRCAFSPAPCTTGSGSTLIASPGMHCAS